MRPDRFVAAWTVHGYTIIRGICNEFECTFAVHNTSRKIQKKQNRARSKIIPREVPIRSENEACAPVPSRPESTYARPSKIATIKTAAVVRKVSPLLQENDSAGVPDVLEPPLS